MFPMFRSAYSADNVWAIGTADGYNYGPAYMYGQTLSFSPALAVANGGVLYQGERSNYGNDLWILSATYNAVNPF